MLCSNPLSYVAARGRIVQPCRPFVKRRLVYDARMFKESDYQGGRALAVNLQFKDFAAAFAFMQEVAALAERMDHHPDWRNVYNRVSIWLSSHDAGMQVTDRDRRMAEAIAALPSAQAAQILG